MKRSRLKIFGIVWIALTIIGIAIGAFFLVSRPAAGLQELRDAPKTFSQSETAVIDTLRFNIASVERDVAVDQTQADECAGIRSNMLTPLAEADAMYVLIKANFEQGKSTFSKPSHADGDVKNFELNDLKPCMITVDGSTVEYLYRVPNNEPLVLTNLLSVYTAINPIFGTEGAPTEAFTYTITLD